MSRILVIGSSNIDLITKVERFPSAGETVPGKLFLQAMGGKGANQALAARRAGGDVTFVTCLGNDANGDNALRYYRAEGLDVSHVKQVEYVPTGTAMILVNDEGENIIVVTPGANEQLLPLAVMQLSREFANASLVMLQMEVPTATVEKACEMASLHNKPVLLNVAPAKRIKQDLIRSVEILIVNETEIETICGEKINDIGEHAAVDWLLSKGAKTVILTLGKKGCIVKNESLNEYIPAFNVDAVDSTAAGDTFCGALAAGLSKGASIVEAVKFATAAAAICVTRIGAQPSIPLAEEISTFLSHVHTNKVPGIAKKIVL